MISLPASHRWITLLVLAVAAAALVYFSGTRINHDVAWYILAGQRWLDGAVLYRGAVDYNLPSAYVLYLPAVLLIKLFALSPMQALCIEVGAVFLLCYVTALSPMQALCIEVGAVFLLCYVTALPLMARLRLSAREYSILHIALLLGLLLHMGFSFGQREHFFMLLITPYLFILALRGGTERIGVPQAILIGVLAGLGCSIKPHFILVPVLARLGATLHRRFILKEPLSFRVMPEQAALFITIGAAWLYFYLAHPLYFSTILPMAQALHGAYDDPALTGFYLKIFAALFAFGFLAHVPQRDADLGSLYCTFMGAALAGAIMYGLQNKGWVYQILPALYFLLVIFALTIMRPGWIAELKPPRHSFRILAAMAMLGFIGYIEVHASFKPMLPSDPRVVQVLKDTPGPFAVQFEENTPAFPTALEMEKTNPWGMRAPCLFMLPGVMKAEMQGQISPYAAVQRVQVAEDLEHYRPVIVLVHDHACSGRPPGPNFNVTEWLAADKGFKREWSHYSRTGMAGCFAVYRRR